MLLGRFVFISASSVFVIVAGGGTAFVRRPVGVAYVALWVVWWLVTAVRQRGVPSAYDRGQRAIVMALSIVAVPILIVAPPWEYAHFTGPIPRDGPLAWVGLALFAAGIALTSAAMQALHGLFTTRLGVQPGHRLVIGGPYRWIRHPGYLGHILCLTGIGLALSSLAALGLVIALAPFILWRIQREEEMLLAEFGKEYQNYKRQMKWRLIPWVY